MNSKLAKRVGIGIGVILFITAGFVVADYFGWFGVERKSISEFVEFRVRTLDAETGRPVSNVKVRCFQYGTNNACGQPPSQTQGVVRINLFLEKKVRDSLLFRHSEGFAPIREKELRIMFIHTEYGKPVQRYAIPDLIANPNQTFTVEMPPLMTTGEGEQQESTPEATVSELPHE